MNNKTVKVSLTLNQIKSIYKAFIDMDANIANYETKYSELYPRWIQDAQYSVIQKLIKAENQLGEK